MKKLIKLIGLVLALVLFITPISAKTNPLKEEVVYSKINLDGSVESLFVVNAFDVFEPTTITDYGSYKSVINTTTNQEIDFDGVKSVIKDVNEGRFFYQGALSGSTQLPWLLDIEYRLDNKVIGAQELGGKSGKLTMTITAKENKNVDPVYFDNYLLTMTFNISSKIISNIKADDATIGNVGDKKTIVFTGMPKTEAKYTLTADIKDFEMDGIQIAALPFSMAMELPDISQFTDGIGDLQYGISQLNSGAIQLAGGLSQLNANTGQLSSGANELSQGSSELSTGASQSAQGTKDFVDGVGEYTGGVSLLSQGSQELVTGSSQIKDGINLLNSNLSQFGDVLTITPEQQVLIEMAIVTLQGLQSFLENDLGSAVFLPIAQSLRRETILALYPQLDPSDPNIEILLNYMDAQATAIEEAYNLLLPFQETIKTDLIPQLDSIIGLLSSLDQFELLIDGVDQLNSQYGEFHDGLIQLSDGLNSLDQNSGTLVSGGQQLSSGLEQLSHGIDQFSDGVSQYATGINQVTDGISQLSSGANQLSGGTQELDKATSDIGPMMEEKIEELMKDFEFEDFDMVSFVDKRNKNVVLVQFVYMSQPITLPKVEEVIDNGVEEKSFFDLFFDLFR